MFQREDTTYNDIRKKSFEQWLCEMEKHEDVAVRCGVSLARQYVGHLEEEIIRQKEANSLKEEYLRKMKQSVKR